MEPLTDTEIEAGLATLGPAWRRGDDEIVADFECENFAAAIALVDRIAAAAELADHHPDILIHAYRQLKITLATHSAGGLTERDFALARTIDALAPR
jgi:4a-hydroxytetrahydrobiopterin dehydratase